MSAGYKVTVKAGGQVVCVSKDVEFNMTADTIDETTRCQSGWKSFVQGMKEWDASIPELFVADNVGLDVLRTAYFTGNPIEIEMTDEDGNGFKGDAIVTGLSFGAPLADAVSLDATLKGTGAVTIVGAS